MTQGANPEMSSSDIYTFIFYTVMMGASVGSLPELYSNIQKAVGSTENLMTIIQSEGENETAKGTLKPVLSGKVSFRDVHFSYPQRKDISVLKGIYIESEPNEMIALVGSSGAGKSTIVSLLLRYFETNSGSILFDDIHIGEIDLEHLRSAMALVPQEVILFGGTIRKNILYGKENATEE